MSHSPPGCTVLPPLPHPTVPHVQRGRRQLGTKIAQRKQQAKHALGIVLPRVRTAGAAPLAVAEQPARAVKEVEAVHGHAGERAVNG